MKKLHENYKAKFEFEVLSGGMIIGEQVQPICKIAPYIQNEYKRVEALTGVVFGIDYLWHINNPEESDWMMNSEKPAIALCIFREYYPLRQIDFARDLQYALKYEGRDLNDDEAYRHLLEKYSIQPEAFYSKLKTDEYLEMANYEFALCRQLNADSFPQVFLQLSESKFYLLTKGFASYDELSARVENILKEIAGA